MLMRHELMVLLFAATVACSVRARGSMIYDLPAGITSAPSGDRGWSDTGSWQVGGGVAIAPNYFLTAQHLGGTVGQSFVLNGRSYTASAFTDIAGSDLRLVQITSTFPAYAPLYRGATGSEAGQAISMVGFGRYAQGSAIVTNGTQNGWNWGAAIGKNFAMNTAVGAVTVGGSQLIDYSFNPLAGQNEGIFTAGDSGGGTFINTGGAWRLAGINFAVTNFFSQPLAPNPLTASIYNGAGLFVKDQNGNFVPATSPQFGYSTEVAAYLSRIDAVIVPGDVNDDGAVNFNDVLTLAQHFGHPGTYSQGDLNFDGTINFNDLLILAQHYGQSLAGSSAAVAASGAVAPSVSGVTTVPEPASLAAPLLLALLTACRTRPRRDQNVN